MANVHSSPFFFSTMIERKRTVRREDNNTFPCLEAPETSAVMTDDDECERSNSCVSSAASTISSVASSPLPHDIRAEGWMFWEHKEQALDKKHRRKKNKGGEQDTFTKVYAVLRNEFLLLYRNDHTKRATKAADRIPLIQIAVSRAGRTIQGAFHVEDPNHELLVLHLYERNDRTAALHWEECLEQAAELTQSHFSTYALTPEGLARDSMFRGTLHDFRLQRTSFRESLRDSVHKKFKDWKSFRSFRSRRRPQLTGSPVPVMPVTP
ncbi:TPA: hypothetical protein N0F65_008567 [Lagenidium giganteum]|uniref:PH domain-containing protein n=1 Tax=Lagenidium giganteum TaxID=4803 RepID=A0AAV2YKJ5_9STRA|nr:TPA: hypothetical protein N0F65_008567 [Lagenidium giganteum]